MVIVGAQGCHGQVNGDGDGVGIGGEHEEQIEIPGAIVGQGVAFDPAILTAHPQVGMPRAVADGGV